MTLLDYPGHFVAVCIAVLLAIATLVGFRTAELRVPGRRAGRGLLMLLQYVTLLMLLVIIWNPSHWRSTPTYRQNTVLAVFDTSRSMSIADGKEPSRLDKALGSFTQHLHPSATAGPEYSVYGFDRRVYHCGTPGLLRRWGEQTDLHSVFSMLSDLAGAGPRDEAGAVIFTDGQTLNKDPRRYRRVARDDLPIVLVGVGSRQPETDVAVTSISAPARVWADTPLAAIVTIEGTNLTGDPVTVELRCDDRIIDTRQLEAGQTEIEFAMGPSAAGGLGSHVLTAQAKPLKAETNLANNVRGTSFEVAQERRLSVLLYTQWANFDVGKIRQALAWDKRIDLDLAFDVIKDPALAQGAGNASGYVKLPHDRDEFFVYDVIILGPCDLSRFTAAQLDGLYGFVADRGGGLLLLPGPSVTSLAAWNDERGNALLPVVLNEREPRLWPPRPDAIDVTFEAEIGRVFSPEVFENHDYALSAYYDIALVKPASTMLARVQETPIASAHRLRRGRVCLLNASKLFTLYRENRQGGLLSEMISGLIGYLGRTPARGAGIELFVERAAENPQRAVFSAYVLDRDFRPVDRANVLLSVGQRVMAMKPLGQGSYSAETDQGYSQAVVATVQAESNGTFLGERTIAANLPPIEDEMSDVHLDEPFLRELARQTGATYVHVDDLDQRAAAAFAPTQQVGTTQTITSSWPTWPLLLTLCALLSINWFLRRAIGLV